MLNGVLMMLWTKRNIVIERMYISLVYIEYIYIYMGFSFNQVYLYCKM